MKQQDLGKKIFTAGGIMFYVRRQALKLNDRIQVIAKTGKTLSLLGTKPEDTFRNFVDAQRYLSYYVPVNG